MQKQRVMLSKHFRGNKQQEEAAVLLPKLTSMLDKLAKKNIIHKKKSFKPSNPQLLSTLAVL